MKINFCSTCNLSSGHNDEGLCDRHEKPIRGMQMKCIHCTRDETTAYGDACPQCGTPCVGELAEPAIVLEEGEDEVSPSFGDCPCKLVREGGEVRLYRCRIHHDAESNSNILDEACRYFGCEPSGLADAIASLQTDSAKALTALGVDDGLAGDDLTKAVDAASEGQYEQSTLADFGAELLDLVGMTEHEFMCDRIHWGAVDFLVSRLQALAPGKLAKELRPRAPRAKRSRKVKAPEPDGGVRLRETFDSNGRLSSIGVDTGETGLRLVKR